MVFVEGVLDNMYRLHADLIGLSSIHAFRSLVASLMKFFPAAPFGSMNKFFFQNTIFS